MKAGCFQASDFKSAQPLVVRLTGHLDDSSGYGTYCTEVALEMVRRGVSLSIYSPATKTVVPHRLKACMTRSGNAPNLVIFPCVIQPARLVASFSSVCYMTMWETTRLTSMVRTFGVNAIKTLNACHVVIVPNAWNATSFSACGVDTPIRVVPLGSDLSKLPVRENKLDSKPFVFGTAARLLHGGIRKGFGIVLEAFKRAFPNEENVRLRLKCFPDDPVVEAGDRRVDQIRRFLSVAELSDWYSSLNVFASGSSSEGWGRHQHEAMCMARPVIGINYGGVAEFFNEDNGYACPWTLEKSEGIYEGMGHYAKPTVAGMAQQMRLAFDDRNLFRLKSELAAKSARRFTIEHSVDGILRVMREFKLA